MQKVFLLDAMALIYRAHFAFAQNPRINSKGLSTGATFGFTNTMLEIIQKEKPTHIAVAFDTAAPTFRHEAFEAYKAHRQEQPEDITLNIPFVKRMISAFQIPILEMPGFEADDIIGTLATQLGSENTKVYMMTSDKDYCQLVTENVFVYRPAFMGKGPEVIDIPKVLEKFQIQYVDQVRDILGLQGDSSDNIPGIPGIGEKTAQKLIATYGTVEALIAHADELSGKMKENVIQFAAQGLQSKELATIHCQVPISVTLDDMEYKGMAPDLLAPLLDELEFRQLKTKLLGGATPNSENAEIKTKTRTASMAAQGQMGLFDTASAEVEATDAAEAQIPLATAQSTRHDYHIMDTEALQQSLIVHLLAQDELCFDTETNQLDPIGAALVGLSFCYRKGEAFYIPIPAQATEAQAIVNRFKPVFEHPGIIKIGHNIKYDIQVLKNYNIEVAGAVYDTMLAHYLIDPEGRHGMDLLSEQLLRYVPISITTLIGDKGKKQTSMRDAPIDQVAEYAAEDADITWQLKQVLHPKLQATGTYPLFQSLENPLVYVLASMERAGVKIDVPFLNDYSKVLETQMLEAEERVYTLAGARFNLSSPKQLGVILFEKLKLEDKPKKTETGQYATGEEILSKLAGEHEVARKILEFREYQKLKSTYVDALPTMIHPQTGLVHTSYNQAVAATGRLSSTDPNLQNIPIRTDLGKEIRKAFIPRSTDSVILSADYSQIELRIMAAFSKDASMMQAFKDGVDIHATTAAKVYKVPLPEVTSAMRRNAKMVNFGIIYGISAFGLAQRLSIPRKEAADIIDAYWVEFPAVKQYMDQCIQTARENEYVTTLLGRRRYLRDINSRNQTVRGFAERNAINAPIQGSAADIIKKAMIDIHAWMHREKLRSQMILQVHDELVFDVYTDELPLLQTQVAALMKNAIELEVPMEIGMGSGSNWLVAH